MRSLGLRRQVKWEPVRGSVEQHSKELSPSRKSERKLGKMHVGDGSPASCFSDQGEESVKSNEREVLIHHTSSTRVIANSSGCKEGVNS